jgi:putative ATPase
VRGSDPDAALYWLAKMVRAGEDPAFIFRRMIILAMEDVGLADPSAITTVISCAEAFDRIGFPEGNFALSEACLRLATAPKSNTTMAYFDALKEVEKEDAEVPNHLRDASRDSESFGHGEGYVYPHAYRDHWAAQQYLPGSLKGRAFYIPSSIGYESKIREEVLRKRELQAAIVLGENETEGELLTWSPAAKGREGWFKRLESGRSALLLSDRNAIFTAASPSRQARVLIPAANDGLLLWESLRRCTEGLTAALVDSPAAGEALLRYAAVLDETEKPLLAVTQEILPSVQQSEEWFSCSEFDNIILRSARLTAEPALLASAAKPLLAKNGSIVLLYSPPRLGMRISRLLAAECGKQDLTSVLEKKEDEFFQNITGAGLWDSGDFEIAFKNEGFTVNIQIIDQKEERLITEKEIASWFNKEQGRWGVFMSQNLEKTDFSAIEDAVRQVIKNGPVLWKWQSICFKANF